MLIMDMLGRHYVGVIPDFTAEKGQLFFGKVRQFHHRIYFIKTNLIFQEGNTAIFSCFISKEEKNQGKKEKIVLEFYKRGDFNELPKEN